MLNPAPAPHTFIHDWSAFWTVVCLGLVQIAVTYYSSHLAVESLPLHIPQRQRARHRRVFTSLACAFILLTLVLAKLNDYHQYQASLVIERERQKQEALQQQLQQTLAAVTSSQADLMAIRSAVITHPAGRERSAMLDSIDRIATTLNRQTDSIQQRVPPSN